MITIKNRDDIAKMRVAGRVAADALTYITPFIVPGITTKELDKKVETFIRAQGLTPGFINYKDFPFTCCISVNEEVVHCVPTDRVLKDGDILTIDTGAIYEGFYSDTAKTFLVGTVSSPVKAFVDIAYQSLIAGINQARPGKYVADISNAVATVITIGRYGIVKDYVGHGIGKTMHEEPQIPNVGSGVPGPELTEGMCICIEPILTLNNPAKCKNVGPWNIVTEAGDVAAHWEHTIYIGPNGPEVLTKRPEENLP